ncbi:hypothetical protein GPECTOR_7g1326 [Gonium pectorale]|uniref:Uncharacterized protein n=1 Tax=Gonium pectorale TaxID=33097 RepID=A0A150GUQ8_GONPE|nr:hypothetical protein GPECTOR_7g1326 [Gonium pectorale]|eukprot:KXZ53428.1 hypothetical protein GPECTOR_7g1326 [Gonium pectorale]
MEDLLGKGGVVQDGKDIGEKQEGFSASSWLSNVVHHVGMAAGKYAAAMQKAAASREPKSSVRAAWFVLVMAPPPAGAAVNAPDAMPAEVLTALRQVNARFLILDPSGTVHPGLEQRMSAAVSAAVECAAGGEAPPLGEAPAEVQLARFLSAHWQLDGPDGNEALRPHDNLGIPLLPVAWLPVRSLFDKCMDHRGKVDAPAKNAPGQALKRGPPGSQKPVSRPPMVPTQPAAPHGRPGLPPGRGMPAPPSAQVRAPLVGPAAGSRPVPKAVPGKPALVQPPTRPPAGPTAVRKPAVVAPQKGVQIKPKPVTKPLRQPTPDLLVMAAAAGAGTYTHSRAAGKRLAQALEQGAAAGMGAAGASAAGIKPGTDLQAGGAGAAACGVTGGASAGAGGTAEAGSRWVWPPLSAEELAAQAARDADMVAVNDTMDVEALLQQADERMVAFIGGDLKDAVRTEEKRLRRRQKEEQAQPEQAQTEKLPQPQAVASPNAAPSASQLQPQPQHSEARLSAGDVHMAEAGQPDGRGAKRPRESPTACVQEAASDALALAAGPSGTSARLAHQASEAAAPAAGADEQPGEQRARDGKRQRTAREPKLVDARTRFRRKLLVAPVKMSRHERHLPGWQPPVDLILARAREDAKTVVDALLTASERAVSVAFRELKRQAAERTARRRRSTGNEETGEVDPGLMPDAAAAAADGDEAGDEDVEGDGVYAAAIDQVFALVQEAWGGDVLSLLRAKAGVKGRPRLQLCGLIYSAGRLIHGIQMLNYRRRNPRQLVDLLRDQLDFAVPMMWHVEGNPSMPAFVAERLKPTWAKTWTAPLLDLLAVSYAGEDREGVNEMEFFRRRDSDDDWEAGMEAFGGVEAATVVPSETQAGADGPAVSELRSGRAPSGSLGAGAPARKASGSAGGAGRFQQAAGSGRLAAGSGRFGAGGSQPAPLGGVAANAGKPGATHAELEVDSQAGVVVAGPRRGKVIVQHVARHDPARPTHMMPALHARPIIRKPEPNTQKLAELREEHRLKQKYGNLNANLTDRFEMLAAKEPPAAAGAQAVAAAADRAGPSGTAAQADAAATGCGDAGGAGVGCRALVERAMHPAAAGGATPGGAKGAVPTNSSSTTEVGPTPLDERGGGRFRSRLGGEVNGGASRLARGLFNEDNDAARGPEVRYNPGGDGPFGHVATYQILNRPAAPQAAAAAGAGAPSAQAPAGPPGLLIFGAGPAAGNAADGGCAGRGEAAMADNDPSADPPADGLPGDANAPAAGPGDGEGAAAGEVAGPEEGGGDEGEEESGPSPARRMPAVEHSADSRNLSPPSSNDTGYDSADSGDSASPAKKGPLEPIPDACSPSRVSGAARDGNAAAAAAGRGAGRLRAGPASGIPRMPGGMAGGGIAPGSRRAPAAAAAAAAAAGGAAAGAKRALRSGVPAPRAGGSVLPRAATASLRAMGAPAQKEQKAPVVVQEQLQRAAEEDAALDETAAADAGADTMDIGTAVDAAADGMAAATALGQACEAAGDELAGAPAEQEERLMPTEADAVDEDEQEQLMVVDAVEEEQEQLMVVDAVEEEQEQPMAVDEVQADTALVLGPEPMHEDSPAQVPELAVQAIAANAALALASAAAEAGMAELLQPALAPQSAPAPALATDGKATMALAEQGADQSPLGQPAAEQASPLPPPEATGEADASPQRDVASPEDTAAAAGPSSAPAAAAGPMEEAAPEAEADASALEAEAPSDLARATEEGPLADEPTRGQSEVQPDAVSVLHEQTVGGASANPVDADASAPVQAAGPPEVPPPGDAGPEQCPADAVPVGAGPLCSAPSTMERSGAHLTHQEAAAAPMETLQPTEELPDDEPLPLDLGEQQATPINDDPLQEPPVAPLGEAAAAAQGPSLFGPDSAPAATLPSPAHLPEDAETAPPVGVEAGASGTPAEGEPTAGTLFAGAMGAGSLLARRSFAGLFKNTMANGLSAQPSPLNPSGQRASANARPGVTPPPAFSLADQATQVAAEARSQHGEDRGCADEEAQREGGDYDSVDDDPLAMRRMPSKRRRNTGTGHAPLLLAGEAGQASARTAEQPAEGALPADLPDAPKSALPLLSPTGAADGAALAVGGSTRGDEPAADDPAKAPKAAASRMPAHGLPSASAAYCDDGPVAIGPAERAKLRRSTGGGAGTTPPAVATSQRATGSKPKSVAAKGTARSVGTTTAGVSKASGKSSAATAPAESQNGKEQKPSGKSKRRHAAVEVLPAAQSAAADGDVARGTADASTADSPPEERRKRRKGAGSGKEGLAVQQDGGAGAAAGSAGVPAAEQQPADGPSVTAASEVEGATALVQPIGAPAETGNAPEDRAPADASQGEAVADKKKGKKAKAKSSKSASRSRRGASATAFVEGPGAAAGATAQPGTFVDHAGMGAAAPEAVDGDTQGIAVDGAVTAAEPAPESGPGAADQGLFSPRQTIPADSTGGGCTLRRSARKAQSTQQSGRSQAEGGDGAMADTASVLPTASDTTTTTKRRRRHAPPLPLPPVTEAREEGEGGSQEDRAAQAVGGEGADGGGALAGGLLANAEGGGAAVAGEDAAEAEPQVEKRDQKGAKSKRKAGGSKKSKKRAKEEPAREDEGAEMEGDVAEEQPGAGAEAEQQPPPAEPSPTRVTRAQSRLQSQNVASPSAGTRLTRRAAADAAARAAAGGRGATPDSKSQRGKRGKEAEAQERGGKASPSERPSKKKKKH